jgi:hypothetical protein
VDAAAQGEDGAANPPEEADSIVSHPANARATKSKSSIVRFDFVATRFPRARVMFFKVKRRFIFIEVGL